MRFFLTVRRGLRTFAGLPWGHSSAGRALAWHARGRRFDPAWLHQDLRVRGQMSVANFVANLKS